MTFEGLRNKFQKGDRRGQHWEDNIGRSFYLAVLKCFQFSFFRFLSSFFPSLILSALFSPLHPSSLPFGISKVLWNLNLFAFSLALSLTPSFLFLPLFVAVWDKEIREEGQNEKSKRQKDKKRRNEKDP